MRPLRIEMHAFGPYAGEQVIDFRALQQHTLFLLAGPTGSGKSTILDAMCYALYGESTGAERTGSGMRCDLAAPDHKTRLVFDFRIGAKHYRVERLPTQYRPSKRGSGTTEEKAQATLWSQPNGVDAEAGPVVATGARNVLACVEELLGFKVHQFRQVVMLPQGRFRELLAADTKKRQVILAQLFQTSRYRRLEEALKAERNAIKKRLEHANTRRQTVLEGVGVDNQTALLQKEKEQQQALQTAQEAMEKRKQIAEQANKRLAEGQSCAAKQAELTASESALATLLAGDEARKQQKVTLDRARAAATLHDVERARQDRRRTRGEAQQKQEDAAASLQRRIEADTQAAVTLAGEAQRADQREAARAQVQRLAELAPQVLALKTAQNDAAASQKAACDATKAETVTIEALARQQAALQSANAELEEAQQAATALPGLEQTAETAKKRLESRLALNAAEERLQAAQTTYANDKEGLSAALRVLDEAQKERARVTQAWVASQAALLATDLEPGAPCPVCGATDHPRPAHSEGGLVDKAAVDEASRAEQQAHQEYDARREVNERKKTAVTTQQTLVQERRESLGDAAKEEVDTLRALAEQAQKTRATGAATAAKVNDLKQAVESATQVVAQSNTALEAARTMQRDAVANAKAAEALALERAARVPEALRAPGALDTQHRRAQEQADALERAWTTAQSTAQEAARLRAVAEETKRQASKDALLALERAEEAEREMTLRIQEAGFASEELYVLAQRSAAAIETLQRTLQEAAEAVAAARDRAQRAKKAAEGLVVPDLKLLADAAATARGASDEALAQAGALREAVQTLASSRTQLEEIARDFAADDQQYTLVGRLTDAATGKNSRKLSYERYVLAALLDDVLAAATLRLHVMSQGRYVLRRQVLLGDGRSAGGLDMEVLDSYSGKARPVGTLSGGEGFQASLALALGLADVVQARAGGIRLDAIFVDEGFGSLDTASLDAAIEALQGLQKGGRLVGLISHVTELHAQIPVRLEVRPERRGSSACFVLPGE